MTYLSTTTLWRSLLACACLSGALSFAACGGKQAQKTETAPQPQVQKLDDAEEIRTTTARDLPERCQEEACINNDVSDFEVDGIRVIVKHVDTPPLVVADIYIEGGALDWTTDTVGHQALALDIATSGGPSTMTRDAYRAALEEAAASIGSSVGRDYATVSMFSPAFAAEKIFGLMSETLQQPAFEPQQIQQSRERTLSAIKTRYDNVDNAVREVTRSVAWKNHPYLLQPKGEVETIQNVEADTLRNALQKTLSRERMLVVFAGKISNDDARNMVKKHLADIPHDPDWATKMQYPEGFHPFSYESGTLEVLARTDIPTNYVLGYFAAPAPGDDDYPAMVIATRLLRNHLFKEVRTKRNLTYAVSSGLGDRRANVGILYVTTTKPKETLTVMYDTIDGLIQDGVTQDDVNNEILSYLTGHYMDLQSFHAQANLLADWTIQTGDRVNADVFIDHVRAVTHQDVQRVLDQYIRHIQYGVVGDPSSIDEQQFSDR